MDQSAGEQAGRSPMDAGGCVSRCAVPWWRALLAPWSELTRPQAAAGRLLAASPRGFWGCFAGHALALAALVVFLLLWSDTVRLSHSRPLAPATRPATASATVRPGVAAPDLVERTIAAVWRDRHREALIGPVEVLFVLVLALTGAGTAFLAWLNLPRVHRSGSALRSYERSLRAVSAGAGLVIVLVGGFGWALVAARHWYAYELTGLRSTPNLFFDLEGLAVLAGPAAACLLLAWLGRATRGAAAPEPELPPRCAGCGYDVTHQRAEARCPECGLNVAASLSSRRRSGSAWERRGTAGSWIATQVELLVHPSRFYAALRLKTPGRAAGRFAGWNYVLLGLGGGLWLAALWWIGGLTHARWADAAQAARGTVVLLFATPLVCWVGHRALAAAVFTWWLAREALGDYAWAEKVIAYESAFLWAFCLFWGLLIGSLMLAGGWIGRLLGPHFFRAYGVPTELAVLALGTVALEVVWLWRYAIAGRAIRWSNY